MYDYFDFDDIRGWVNLQVASYSKGELFDYPPPPYFCKEYPAKGHDKKHMNQFWDRVIEPAVNRYWEANGNPENKLRKPSTWDFPYEGVLQGQLFCQETFSLEEIGFNAKKSFP